MFLFLKHTGNLQKKKKIAVDLVSLGLTSSTERSHWPSSRNFWKIVFHKTRHCLPPPRPPGLLPVWPAMTMGCTNSWKSLSSTRCRKSTRGSRREELRQMMLSFSSCSRAASLIFWSSTRMGKVTWLSREWQSVKNFSRWLSWEGRWQASWVSSPQHSPVDSQTQSRSSF